MAASVLPPMDPHVLAGHRPQLVVSQSLPHSSLCLSTHRPARHALLCVPLLNHVPRPQTATTQSRVEAPLGSQLEGGVAVRGDQLEGGVALRGDQLEGGVALRGDQLEGGVAPRGPYALRTEGAPQTE